jgi:hypothetical protein
MRKWRRNDLNIFCNVEKQTLRQMQTSQVVTYIMIYIGLHQNINFNHD